MIRRAARVSLLTVVGLLALGAGLARSAAGPSRKERLAALPDDERVWLTDYVAPIIFPEEERLFLELTQPHERERFKKEFWARRELESQSPPLGPGYEVRYAELRRLADEVYDGWRNDAGRMVLRYGEPASLEPVRTCEHVFRDLELWHYPQGAGGIPLLLFYRFPENGPRRLWNLGVPDSEIFARDSCRQRRKDLAMDCTTVLGDPCRGPVCGEACRVGKILLEISWRQGNGAGAERERGRLLAPLQIPLEGLDRVKDVSATAADPKAKPLNVTGPSATVPAAAAAPAAKRSKKELRAELPDEERAWVTSFVAPIILKEEEELFLELTEGYQREIFKKDFWERREVDSLGPPFGQGFQQRYEELRPRLDSVYDGWRNDAAQLALHYGEPSDIHHVEGCDMVFRDIEIWTYTNLGMARGNVHHLFYRPMPVAPRKLWRETTTRLEKQQRLNPYGADEIFSPSSCRRSLEELRMDCQPVPNDKCNGPVCFEACDVYRAYQEELSRQGDYLGGISERARLLKLPEISTEGLDRLRKRFATTADPNAKPLSVTGPSATVPVAAPSKPALKKSKKELLAELPDEERAWLTSFVAPIILKEEEDLFLELTEGYQREIFKKDFWERRELDSLGLPYGLGFKQRYEELRPLLDSVYDGWRNDAAQLVLHYGEPSNIDHAEGCDNVFRDLEIWTYPLVSGARGVNHFLLFRPSPRVPRKLWRMDMHSNASFDDVFVPKSPPWTWAAVGSACRGELVCGRACDVYRIYQEVVSRQGSYIGGLTESARLFKLPEISTEGLERLRTRFATTANPNAKPLSVEGPGSKPRATPEPTPTPEPFRALTAEEIRDRIVHLEPKYRQFLDLAGPLLTQDELQRFVQLTPKDRDRFIKEFWKRRS